jgi:hypothetical protein
MIFLWYCFRKKLVLVYIGKNFEYHFRHINTHYSKASHMTVTTYCQWQPWHAALEIPISQWQYSVSRTAGSEQPTVILGIQQCRS